MPEEFEGDLAGAVFWGADLHGARFRDVDLSGVRISHAWLVDVDIDAFIDRIVVNGVDVTAYVNEHDRWYPLRSVLRTSDPDSMRAAHAALEEAWARTVERARGLPDEDLHVSVDGEWSFVQTLRHLVFAADKWFTAPILGGRFHPFGLTNIGSIDFPWPDLDREAAPSLADVLAARADQATRLRDYLAAMTSDDLTRSVDVLENGPHLVRDCISTIFEEAFWHDRYAERDLARLENAAVSDASGLDIRGVLAIVEAEQARTARQVASLEAVVAAIVDGSELVSTDDEHDPEGATIAYERAQATALLRQARDDGDALVTTRRQLEQRRRPVCSVCGRQIDLERIAALPTTSRCIHCA